VVTAAYTVVDQHGRTLATYRHEESARRLVTDESKAGRPARIIPLPLRTETRNTP
jgi:hypothetical protein